MLDAFFGKGSFKAAKCKTMLKLTIPRIKLLRNRREIQIKQMRRDIAKLLETGQEATARIRVEHIIREENMMAAQEIIELYCELIAVRLPIIELQRECPLDLKEAISSVCFAAPRCADLPELQQVQLLFASKYGKEFIAAATELMPDCGVNRQLIELLSIRAPSAEVKLKLLKEIAEEHELDWDPAASETELYKPHEDLLNGPEQLENQSKLPLPKEKHEDTIYSSAAEASHEKSDSELDFLGLPEVPKGSLRPLVPDESSVKSVPPEAPPATEKDHESTEYYRGEEYQQNESSVKSVPPEAPSATEKVHDSTEYYTGEEDHTFNEPQLKRNISDPEQFVSPPHVSHNTFVSERKDQPFVARPHVSQDTFVSERKDQPFVTPPHVSHDTFVSEREDKQFSQYISPLTSSSPTVTVPAPQSRSSSKLNSELDEDLQDVLAAAHAAAESAERAAASARSAANLAQVRITELIKKKHENMPDNSEHTFYTSNLDDSSTAPPRFDHQQSFQNLDSYSYSMDPHQQHGLNLDVPSPSADVDVPSHESTHHQPQRLTSLEDDPYFSYPNLFTAQDPNLASDIHSVDKM